jgi:hypothetical protein
MPKWRETGGSCRARTSPGFSTRRPAGELIADWPRATGASARGIQPHNKTTKPATRRKEKMKTPEHVINERNRHNAALLSLANNLNPHNRLSGLQIWRKLRRIESLASKAATAQCNGESYGGQPFRDDDQWEAFKAEIENKVAAVFGGTLPKRFFVNGDPRGYALKLDCDEKNQPATKFDLHQDLGRYQILAPDIR